MRFSTTRYALMGSLMLLGCGAESSQNSASKWAHVPSRDSMSIINARIQYLDLKFKTDFDKVAVCVQGSDTYRGSGLLLETKLAYAAWLNASGQGSERTWNHLTFKLKSKCKMDDSNYSSVIVISQEPNITPDQEIGKTFSKNKVSCQRVGYSANCSTGSMTMGLGGSGTISYRYSTPKTWDTLINSLPATALLSPYVQWTSMESALKTPTLKSTYALLKEKAETVSYPDLVRFNTALETAELKLADNDRLDGLLDTFLNSNKTSLMQTYVPRQPGYHVLLHEVGHQFGMQHADNPDSDSETGSSPGSSKEVNGQWSTEKSAMAYADQYLYLTADDKAGILHLATKNAKLVKAHRGF